MNDVTAGAAGRSRRRAVLDRFGPIVALAILLVASAALSPVFLKPENLLNILNQNAFVGIIAIGMTFVIIMGGIDLSVGSLTAFAGGLGILAMNAVAPVTARSGSVVVVERETLGVLVAVAAILAVGPVAGCLNGLVITKGRIAPFIATLGALAIFRSLALTLIDAGEYRPTSPTRFHAIGGGGIPIPFTNVAPGAPTAVPLILPYPVLVFIAVACGAHVLLSKTRYGRYVVAIGCSERAARYSAISVDRIKVLTYTLVGGTCGITALLEASRYNSVSSSQAGMLYELDAIAAAVIGGTRMNGGAGSIAGTVVGVLILGVTVNLLGLLQVSPHLQGFVKGLIIIAAVLIQRGEKPGAS